MNAERIKQIEEIHNAALEIAPAEREAFFRQRCGEDAELRREVESLISFDNSSDSLMDTPLESLAAEVFFDREEQSNLTGSKISHYKIERLLGRGGMGDVFLAEDSHLRRKVTLKVLPENIASDEDRLRRFKQEAFAASALNHPNILTIYEFSAENNLHFLATEFIEGETLKERLDTVRLNLKEAVDIAEQIAAALAAAHQAGIAHRDIKPENIMLRDDGLVKVLDFGLAKLAKKGDACSDTEAETRELVITNPGVVRGTVSYMSPEQARGKDTDVRTDIFSYGIVLYEMLANRLPFSGETISDVIAEILKSEPEPPTSFNAEIPPELERIVLKSLAKDREERYQTAKDLLVDLRYLKGQIEIGTEIERTKPPVKPEEIISENDAGRQSLENTEKQMAAFDTASASPPFRTSASQKLLWFIIGFIALAGIGYIVYQNYFAVQTLNVIVASRIVPCSSATGSEDSPAFSPDGRQIAYSWNGGERGANDIYVRLVGAGEPLQLTKTKANEQYPTFSPDGSHIAFIRGEEAKPSEVIIIPSLGGAERRVARLFSNYYSISYAPDGQTIAVIDTENSTADGQFAVYLFDVQIGERRRVTAPAEFMGETTPRFSPDGKNLAFIRMTRDIAKQVSISFI